MNQNEKVHHFFREISKIPRESHDEKAISDYLMQFAKERDLSASQDEWYNVIIKKPASVVDCSCEPVIFQGHIDMVYVKDKDSKHVYANGIEIIEKDGMLTANGTTLGADNGIAIAYMLALLDNDTIPHPDLEMVMTAQEETGLAGAQNIDCSGLKGKYFINLDAEEEGIFFTSCAGGVRNNFTIPVTKTEQKNLSILSIVIDGLKGGHSGMEIHLGRGNAMKLMARLLQSIDMADMHLMSIECEGKSNAIPNSCKAAIAISPAQVKEITQKIEEIGKVFRAELQGTDNIAITINAVDAANNVLCYDTETKSKIIKSLILIPYGVLGMSFAIEGLVETSSNVGLIDEKYDTNEKKGSLTYMSSVRSSVASQKRAVQQSLDALAELIGATSEYLNDYPAWAYAKESPLRDIACAVYEEKFNKKPTLGAVHAGLECGYFDERMKGIDLIAFGPDMFDVHSVNERVNIASINNTWILIVGILEKFAKQ